MGLMDNKRVLSSISENQLTFKTQNSRNNRICTLFGNCEINGGTNMASGMDTGSGVHTEGL